MTALDRALDERNEARKLLHETEGQARSLRDALHASALSLHNIAYVRSEDDPILAGALRRIARGMEDQAVKATGTGRLHNSAAESWKAAGSTTSFHSRHAWLAALPEDLPEPTSISITGLNTFVYVDSEDADVWWAALSGRLGVTPEAAIDEDGDSWWSFGQVTLAAWRSAEAVS